MGSDTSTSFAAALHDQRERLGEHATELIGSAAGSVVEPRKGMGKLWQAVRRPSVVLFLVALVLLAALVKGRRHG